MPRKSYKPEEIIAMLRQLNAPASQGQSIAEAIRAIGANLMDACSTVSTFRAVTIAI